MYTINSGDVSYQLPLDDIDLGCIKRNIAIGDTIKPLWTPQQNNYYQFQLSACRKDDKHGNADEDDDSGNENLTTMCHICKMSVPTIYIEEHNKGNIHRLLVKIIKEALERARNNINMGTKFITIPKLSKKTFYCDMCCSSIPITEKDTHKKSAMHKKKRKENKMLDKFSIFFDKSNITVESDEFDDESNDSNNNLIDNEIKVTTKLSQLETYVNSLKKQNGSLTIDVIDENFLAIKFNSTILKLPIDNFHSFDIYGSTADGELVCLLCKSIVSSKEHIWSDEHMKNVMLPLADEHCLRQINHYQAHCIICNELIKNVELHKQMDINHKIKLKNAKVLKPTPLCPFTEAISKQTQNTTKLPDTKRNLENVSKSDCDKENRIPIVTKMNEINPKVEVAKKLSDSCKSNGNKKVDRPKIENMVPKLPKANVLADNTIKSKLNDDSNDRNTNFVHYMIRDTHNPKEVICRVCLCVIPALVSNINDHLKGKRHLNTYKESLTANKMNKVENGFACDVCKLHVGKEMEITHIFSEAHKLNIRVGVEQNIKSSTSNGKYITTNAHLVDSRNYAEVAAKMHKVEQNEPGKSNDVVHPTSTNNSEKSSICESNTSKNMETPNQKTNQPEKEVMKLNYHLKKLSETIVLCKVCDIMFTNSVENIITHLNGHHYAKYEQLLKTNKVSMEGFNFHCHKCDVPITKKNELDHIFGNRHKTNEDTIKTSAMSEINQNQSSSKKPVNVEPSTSKINNGDNTVNNKFHHFNKSGTNLVMCRICKVVMLNTVVNKTSHVKGSKHESLYDKLMEKHIMFNNLGDNFVYCGICTKVIPLQQELNHIEDEEHIQLLELQLNSLKPNKFVSSSEPVDNGHYCEFCSVHCSSSTYEEHKISHIHVSNVRKFSKFTLDLQKDSYTKSKSTLKCKICECYVHSNFSFVLEHIQGTNHKRKFNKVLDTNKISMVDGKLYCLACKDGIKDEEEMFHIRDPNHTGNLSLMS